MNAKTLIAWSIIILGMKTLDATPLAAETVPPAAAPVAFYSAENYRVGQSVGFLMRRIVAGVSCSVDRKLAAHDLTNAQWSPLFLLWQGRFQTVAELARECCSDAGAMTRMLDRLEAKGLVRRERSSQDRRVIQVQLTDEGRQVAPVVPKVLAEVLNEHLAGFTFEEWQTLRGFLERMAATGERLKDRSGADADGSSL
jgi:DNA-binding MarR family transcriptional regulator